MVKKENAPADVTSIDRGRDSDNIDNYSTQHCDLATIVEILALIEVLNAHRKKIEISVIFERNSRDDNVTFFYHKIDADLQYQVYSTSDMVELYKDPMWIYSPGLISALDELRRRVNECLHCMN